MSGDRQKEGVFPLWTVLANISIGRVGPRPALGLVSDRAERLAAAPAAERIRLDLTRFNSRIVELSGGNQQKALVSRAVAAMTPIVLLDDPTRGVDIATKQDFYRLCSELAREGRTLIWHTTEDAELLGCDRVLVLANGQIVRELSGPALTEEAIVAASFSHLAATEPDRNARSAQRRLRLVDRLVDAAPLLGLALVLAVMIAANPAVASVFGLDLLLMPALSLVLVTEAQMFVVGGAEIDLGVGAFAGLVSVLSATLLYDRPALGVLAIAIVVGAYAMLGAIIQSRKIPAIVVTLGASFIWAGIGYPIQPTPGGASPNWLSALTNWSIGSYAPTSTILIGAVAAVGALLDLAPLGVVLRGFGANPAAMIASGWPPIRYGVVRYLVAGLFSAAAGLSLTAINSSSDINSGNSFTLLSVAAVVMGGCALTGGIVAPVGAVLGAVTLALIGALLGALGVSSDFNAAAQGAVLDRAPRGALSGEPERRGMIPLRKFFELTQSHRWIWSALAVLIFWGALSVVTNRFSVASLSGIVLSASYLSMVGVGQMFVVTTGRANIDLSIASVVTLSAYVALLTVGGRDANLLWGVLVALGLGLVVGCLNAALVVRLRVPAIIATLATGYVLATATLLCNRSIHGFAVSPALRAIAAGRFLGAPIMLLVCVGLIALAEFVLRRTVYGRTLSAVGQSRIAARLTGIPVDRVVAIAFVISGVLASLMGLVLGAMWVARFLRWASRTSCNR